MAVVAGTALGSALIGGTAGFLTARLTNTHQLELAREERQQDRRGQAYLAMLNFLHALARCNMERARNFLYHADPGAVTAPETGEADNVLALVTAFGSDEAQSAFVDVTTTLNLRLLHAYEECREAREAEARGEVRDPSWPELAKAAHAADKEMADAIRALRHLTKRELQGE